MSYSQSYASQHSHASHNDAGHAIRSISGMADEYRQGVKDNQSYGRIAAVRLVKDGAFEKMLVERCQGKENETEQAMEWLTTQRTRLKTLAKSADERANQIERFIQALDHVGQMEQVESYEEVLTSHVSQGGQVATQGGNENYLEICKRLGEPEKSKSARGDRRRSSDDDDLEVLPPTQESAQHSLRCPISASYLEKPVRNKVCNHVYSKEPILAAIEYYSRSRGGCKCPVPGCANQNVTKEQLEDDREKEILVRRQKLLEQSQQSQMSQMAIDADFDDDEEEDEEDEFVGIVKPERIR